VIPGQKKLMDLDGGLTETYNGSHWLTIYEKLAEVHHPMLIAAHHLKLYHKDAIAMRATLQRRILDLHWHQ